MQEHIAITLGKVSPELPVTKFQSRAQKVKQKVNMPRLTQTRQNFKTAYTQQARIQVFPSPAESITLTTRVTSTLAITLACFNSDYYCHFFT